LDTLFPLTPSCHPPAMATIWSNSSEIEVQPVFRKKSPRFLNDGTDALRLLKPHLGRAT
jgi:hypothetical protein